jgi:hypothetical protein
VRNNIVALEAKDIQSDCEDLWVKINLFGSKSLLIGTYYKPHKSDHYSSSESAKSLNKARKLNSNLWTGGEFNLPKMDWTTMCPSPNCKHSSYYKEIIETLNESNLTQTVTLPTWESNILDLFLTTNPTLIQKVGILPRISDHDVVQFQVSTSAKIVYQKPRNIG